MKKININLNFKSIMLLLKKISINLNIKSIMLLLIEHLIWVLIVIVFLLFSLFIRNFFTLKNIHFILYMASLLGQNYKYIVPLLINLGFLLVLYFESRLKILIIYFYQYISRTEILVLSPH